MCIRDRPEHEHPVLLVGELLPYETQYVSYQPLAPVQVVLGKEFCLFATSEYPNDPLVMTQWKLANKLLLLTSKALTALNLPLQYVILYISFKI